MSSGTSVPRIPLKLGSQRPFEGCLVDTGVLLAATAKHPTDPGTPSSFDNEIKNRVDTKKLLGFLQKLNTHGRLILTHTVIQAYSEIMRAKASSTELSSFNYGTYEKIEKNFRGIAGPDPLLDPKLGEKATEERKNLLRGVVQVLNIFGAYCAKNPQDQQALGINRGFQTQGIESLTSQIELAIRGPNQFEIKQWEEVEAARQFLSNNSPDVTPAETLGAKIEVIHRHKHLFDKYDLRKKTCLPIELLLLSHHLNLGHEQTKAVIFTLDPNIEHIQKCVGEIHPELVGKAVLFTEKQIEMFLLQARNSGPEKLSPGPTRTEKL